MADEKKNESKKVVTYEEMKNGTTITNSMQINTQFIFDYCDGEGQNDWLLENEARVKKADGNYDCRLLKSLFVGKFFNNFKKDTIQSANDIAKSRFAQLKKQNNQ